MAKEESHRLTPTQLADRVWEIAENIQFCLYTSVKGSRLQQWPLTAKAERDERAFYFLVGQKGGKYSNLRRAPEVVLGFADPGGPKYVVINGTARLSNDRGKSPGLFPSPCRAASVVFLPQYLRLSALHNSKDHPMRKLAGFAVAAALFV